MRGSSIVNVTQNQLYIVVYALIIILYLVNDNSVAEILRNKFYNITQANTK